MNKENITNITIDENNCSDTNNNPIKIKFIRRQMSFFGKTMIMDTTRFDFTYTLRNSSNNLNCFDSFENNSEKVKKNEIKKKYKIYSFPEIPFQYVDAIDKTAKINSLKKDSKNDDLLQVYINMVNFTHDEIFKNYGINCRVNNDNGKYGNIEFDDNNHRHLVIHKNTSFKNDNKNENSNSFSKKIEHSIDESIKISESLKKHFVFCVMAYERKMINDVINNLYIDDKRFEFMYLYNLLFRTAIRSCFDIDCISDDFIKDLFERPKTFDDEIENTFNTLKYTDIEAYKLLNVILNNYFANKIKRS
ncbi:hypothetical protein C7U55_05225 [Faecalibacillus faecis]|uniref:Uncharacterized protein n=1 Tax=Faecalibacillus faecis TaxID=1982628 RepID=A0A2T3G0G6_9FIRM|nr:hypothetical protein [Faecalibacillus faecis]PST41045.1 hypothetical protein C7U55_05225 [Faecalibacillus faecis]